LFALGVKLGLSHYGLREFDNGVLSDIFGSKREEVTGHWRKLHNEKHHNLYFSPDITQTII
jgi:hypothetical protein